MRPFFRPTGSLNLSEEKETRFGAVALFSSRWFRFLLAILLGLGLGLVFGWVVSPLEYSDTSPVSLRADYQADYVLMVAEVYHARHDLGLAASQLSLLSNGHPAEIAARAFEFALQENYPESDLILIQNLGTAVQNWQIAPETKTP